MFDLLSLCRFDSTQINRKHWNQMCIESREIGEKMRADGKMER